MADDLMKKISDEISHDEDKTVKREETGIQISRIPLFLYLRFISSKEDRGFRLLW